MKVEKLDYKGHQIRYTIVAESGILLNTKDVCNALYIEDRPDDSALSKSCIDIVSCIKVALTEDKNNMEFVDWLEHNFIGYSMKTSIRLNCNDDWTL